MKEFSAVLWKISCFHFSCSLLVQLLCHKLQIYFFRESIFSPGSLISLMHTLTIFFQETMSLVSSFLCVLYGFVSERPGKSRKRSFLQQHVNYFLFVPRLPSCCLSRARPPPPFPLPMSRNAVSDTNCMNHFLSKWPH